MFGRRAHPVWLCVLCLLLAPAARAAHPNALWRVVHELCVTDRKISGLSAPCMAVNLRRGFAVVRDPGEKTQVLLVPTARIAGIESPRLLDPDRPNYWQAAWEARIYFEKRARRAVPRDDIGMAINSKYGRTQDQLHIHIDCVRQDIRQTLRANQSEISERWSWLRFSLAGRHYRARWVEGVELGDRDPFKLLADASPVARSDMGRQTLAVIAATRADGSEGFVVLSTRGDTWDNPRGAAEELLDHQCEVLRQ